MRDAKLLIELRAVFKGRVQGVGFRATVKMLADSMQLTGFARNLPDGSVEVCAQGEKPHLEKLLARLKEEFFSRHIENIETDFRQPEQKYSDFRILR